MLIGLDGNEANVKNRVGSGVYALALLKEFQKNKDHEFTVYLKDNPLSDLPPETTTFKYRVFGPKKLWTRVALPVKLTLGKKPDIFFSMGHYGPRYSVVPYAVTIFDLSYLHYPELFKKNDLYQLINWSKHSIINSKHIFAISQKTKDDILNNYNVPASKITVTYMGYDQKRFKPQEKSKIEKVKVKYKTGENYIIFVGTLQPRKNFERLIDAFSNLEIKNKSYNLVVVGKKGWMYDQIFKKVEDLNIKLNVVFTGFVPDDDLPALISGAKAYILPSLWEGFGIPVIEAQACGIPTIVSNVSSLPEVVESSALLIDPEDTKSITNGIKKVLDDDKYAKGIVEKGFKNIKRFSWQKCAQETLRQLESLNP